MKRDPTHILKENWIQFIECGCIFSVDKDQYIIGWGKRSWSESEGTGPFFYFPDFFLSDPRPWFQHQHTAFVSAEELMSKLPDTKCLQTEWYSPHFSGFESTFQELKANFESGLLKKAVPYLFTESTLAFNASQLMTSLRNMLTYARTMPVHLYGFWDEREGILGASPEILFTYSKEKNCVIKTAALAGTKSHIDQKNLMKDPKERLEHQLVIEGIRQSLSHLGNVIIEQTQILLLPKLFHLMTPIQVETEKSIDFLSIVRALHPTPALGAFPKNEGWEWLKAYEQKMPRQRYGAPIGYIDEKRAKCIVGIRNAQWDQEKTRIGAGCGVVVESNLEKEWQEIHLKISSIKEMLSL